MSTFAHIVGPDVIDVTPDVGDLTPAELYEPEIAAQFVPCPLEVRPGWTFDGVTFAPPPEIVPPAVDLSAYAAAKRYTVETGGITVAGNVIATDRASQAMIAGAYNFAQANPAAVIKFKADSGFVDLDAAAVTAVANAVGAHVQASFAAEADVLASIAAETITSVEDIDGFAWPGGS
ncbi:DUF4376 domain-containing protein [Ancylobacter pratisalsi]|uniref:DUF4376 domain-containing protein n=1 Tax=Ancylobacter pratisalsi TaxID=1745854 RepID=A0A6P1YPW4_9HYPH|nr:DUF4376 domain-containing protein [Ancylobacter pratisalsi]QIB34736.1 DUF4376 domain-containing protein [Ancylobacter pratisalsi]